MSGLGLRPKFLDLGLGPEAWVLGRPPFGVACLALALYLVAFVSGGAHLKSGRAEAGCNFGWYCINMATSLQIIPYCIWGFIRVHYTTMNICQTKQQQLNGMRLQRVMWITVWCFFAQLRQPQHRLGWWDWQAVDCRTKDVWKSITMVLGEQSVTTDLTTLTRLSLATVSASGWPIITSTQNRN